MAIWGELSLDSLRAAKLLALRGHLRSSISRAYYAAYAAVAGELVARGVSFPHGWSNPAHDQLLQMITHNLPLSPDTRRRMARGIHLLREAREDADYRPGISVSRDLVRECLRLSSWVMRALGTNDD